MRKKHYDKTVYRSFALILQVGVNMLVPICMMTALGIFLDEKFETGFWMIVLFIVGAIAGGQNSYRMVKRVLDSPNQSGTGNHRRNEQGENRQKETGSGNALDGEIKENQ